ncbi:putative pectinesterase precursor [Fistulina hepatica ATCC 64428]|uniref:Pectinesterase n=1 Tax=Fistulina hepatica ATCC 64428 TaxID=1128425 RepID=A0A0D7AEY3_9AGAR|nr:putative pectinesterase precursor [Fistulina hepatica ATCC 64428]
MFNGLVLAALTISSLKSEVAALSSAPSGAITVGSSGTYSTLTEALEDTSSDVYFVYSGTYDGQVLIDRDDITIYGQTDTDDSYSGNTVIITGDTTADEAGSDAESATVRITASGVSLYNIDIENTYGTEEEHSQAIALSIEAGDGGTFGGYGINVSGYQDTLLVESGYQFYGNSYIEGAVDFIFGQYGSVWITNSVINCVGTGYITASGRSSDDAYWYVINSSTVEGDGEVYLGRPWADYARVVFQSTALGSNIQSAGWSVWSESEPNIEYVTFAEYGNTGDGASGDRASFATKLDNAVDITTVLGSDYTSWVDSDFLD